jgi:hypothetical protein
MSDEERCPGCGEPIEDDYPYGVRDDQGRHWHAGCFYDD